MTPPRSTSPAIWPNGASNPAAALPAQMALCNLISCPSRWRQKRSYPRTARQPSPPRQPAADAAALEAALVAAKVEERVADKAVERPPAAATQHRPHPQPPILNMARNGPAEAAEAAGDAADLPWSLSTFRPI